MEHRLPVSKMRELALALAREHDDADRWRGPAYFVGVVDANADGLELAVQGVEPPDAHPIDVLPSLAVPSHWLAFGLVACGWARSLDRPAAPRCRVRSVELFRRDGLSVAVLDRETHAEPLVIEHRPDDPQEPIGRLADGLRHALGLPTPVCPVTMLEYAARAWLSAIAKDVDQPQSPRRTSSWARLARLHPALAARERGQPARLVAAARAVAARIDWGDMREAVAHGDLGLGVDLAPAVAAWMDDEMFARFIVAGMPDLVALREHLAGRLPPRLLVRVDETLEAWGLSSTERVAAARCAV